MHMEKQMNISRKLPFDLKEKDDRPAVLVAACLAGVPCRYHGQAAPPRRALLDRLQRKYKIVFVCPEQLGGLPTPRPPSRWSKGRLMAAGKDVTEYFERGAERTLEEARQVKALAFYGLRGSPSCDPKTGVTARLLSRAGIKTRFG
jgi:uncharacterized protein YbbK (DUF523 family)